MFKKLTELDQIEKTPAMQASIKAGTFPEEGAIKATKELFSLVLNYDWSIDEGTAADVGSINASALRQAINGFFIWCNQLLGTGLHMASGETGISTANIANLKAGMEKAWRSPQLNEEEKKSTETKAADKLLL